MPLTDLKEMTRPASASPAPPSACRTLADAEREHILEALKLTGGIIGGFQGAASRLGLPRTTLIYKMRKLGIEVRRAHRSRAVSSALDGFARRFDAVGSY